MENYLVKVNDNYLKFTEDSISHTKHVNTENGALLTITAPTCSYNEKCTNSADIIRNRHHSGLLTIMDEIRKTNQLFDYSFKKTDVITFMYINTDYTSLNIAGFLYFEDKVS